LLFDEGPREMKGEGILDFLKSVATKSQLQANGRIIPMWIIRLMREGGKLGERKENCSKHGLSS
jgi:hypothetical protein